MTDKTYAASRPAPTEIADEAAEIRKDADHLQKTMDEDYDEARNDGDPDDTVDGGLVP